MNSTENAAESAVEKATNKVSTAAFTVIAMYGLMLYSTSKGDLASISLWHWISVPVLGLYVYLIVPAITNTAKTTDNVFTHFLSGALGGGVPLSFFVLAIGSLHRSNDLAHYIVLSLVICVVLGIISAFNRGKQSA